MQTISVQWLQSLQALQEVPEDQLQWLIDNSNHYKLPEGAVFFKSGEPISGTHIIKSGKIQLYIADNSGMREVAVLEGGDISGYLPFSRGFTANANGRVIKEATMMTLPVEHMSTLIATHYELTQALVHVMTTRVRDFTAMQQQNEKMMSLGKLSAGLAHELNNPAAAIVRSADSLKKHLQLLPETFKQVISIRLDGQQVDVVNNIMFEVLARNKPAPLTLLQRKQREDDLIDCLEDNDIANLEDIAENFVEVGFTEQDMNTFLADNTGRIFIAGAQLDK